MYNRAAASTLSTEPSDGAGAAARSQSVADELILLLDCNRPSAGSARYRLAGVDEVAVGRGIRRQAQRSGRQLVIKTDDLHCSAVHALIFREGNEYVLRDNGSKNGLIVNGARIQVHALRDRDIVECGNTFFLYRSACARPSDEPLDLDSSELAPPAPELATFLAPLAAQFRLLAELARTALPIVIQGPTGVGKELVARAVHRLSRREGHFVAVNCGALPSTVIESELLGGQRPAQEGERGGLVRASHHGTLFLDEVGELPWTAQATLLRTLEEVAPSPEAEVASLRAAADATANHAAPKGDTAATRAGLIATGRPRVHGPLDLRLVATSTGELGALARDQRFRPDLFARLDGFTVRLPSLCERLEDFGILVAALLERHAHPPATVTVEAMRLMLSHRWPLNIRELELCLRAALALSPDRVQAAYLAPRLRALGPPVTQTVSAPGVELSTLDRVRRSELCRLLLECHGNISEVARRLNKDRAQIRRWIRAFQISKEEYSS